MDLKKMGFIDAYKKTFGNITQSCNAIGVHRQTFYDWCNNDQEFKEIIDAIEPQEVFIDFAENALVKRISDGDTTAIIFALKTKGKKRGYVERTEHTIDFERPIFNGIDLDVQEDNGTKKD